MSDTTAPLAKGFCWPWSHQWSMWDLGSMPYARVRFHDGKWVESGTGVREVQQRRCVKCGKYQREELS